MDNAPKKKSQFIKILSLMKDDEKNLDTEYLYYYKSILLEAIDNKTTLVNIFINFKLNLFY